MKLALLNIATRFEKLARNFLALIHIPCAMLWLQDIENAPSTPGSQLE